MFQRKKKKCSVTCYAADTFVYFILTDEHSNPGDSEAKDKYLKTPLFDQYKKLPEMRKEIRANLEKLGIHPNMSPEELNKILYSLLPEN